MTSELLSRHARTICINVLSQPLLDGGQAKRVSVSAPEFESPGKLPRMSSGVRAGSKTGLADLLGVEARLCNMF